MNKFLFALFLCVCIVMSFCIDAFAQGGQSKKDYDLLARELENLAVDEPYVVANVYRMIAESYQRKDDADNALTYYLSALKFAPSDEGLLNTVSDLYMQKDDIDGAIKYAEILVKVNKSNTYYYQRLAELYKKKGDADKASEIWKEALKGNEDNADLRRQLAENYAMADDYDNAIKEIKAAIELDPANLWFKRLLAKYMYESGNVSPAVEVLLKANDASTDVWEKRDMAYELANMLYNEDNKDKFVEPFIKKVEKGTDDPFDYWLLSQVYMNSGELEEAIAVFEKAVKTVRGRELKWQLVGLYQESGELEKAEALIKDEIAQDGNDPEPVNRLADLYMSFGKYGEAVEVLEKAQKLMPSNLYFSERIGDIYAGRGETDKAIAKYQEVMAQAKEQWQKDDMQRRIDALRTTVEE